jgi:hypothetical protein
MKVRYLPGASLMRGSGSALSSVFLSLDGDEPMGGSYRRNREDTGEDEGVRYVSDW